MLKQKEMNQFLKYDCLFTGWVTLTLIILYSSNVVGYLDKNNNIDTVLIIILLFLIFIKEIKETLYLKNFLILSLIFTLVNLVSRNYSILLSF